MGFHGSGYSMDKSVTMFWFKIENSGKSSQRYDSLFTQPVSHSVMSDFGTSLCKIRKSQAMAFKPPTYLLSLILLDWVVIFFPGSFPYPGIKPRSPHFKDTCLSHQKPGYVCLSHLQCFHQALCPCRVPPGNNTWEWVADSFLLMDLPDPGINSGPSRAERGYLHLSEPPGKPVI